MTQFDVVGNPSHSSRLVAPFVTILQSHYLAPIDTTLVCPLYHRRILAPDDLLFLPLMMQGELLTLALPLVAPVVTARLGQPIGSLADAEYEIRRALDRLFTGF